MAIPRSRIGRAGVETPRRPGLSRATELRLALALAAIGEARRCIEAARDAEGAERLELVRRAMDREAEANILFGRFLHAQARRAEALARLRSRTRPDGRSRRQDDHAGMVTGFLAEWESILADQDAWYRRLERRARGITAGLLARIFSQI